MLSHGSSSTDPSPVILAMVNCVRPLGFLPPCHLILHRLWAAHGEKRVYSSTAPMQWSCKGGKAMMEEFQKVYTVDKVRRRGKRVPSRRRGKIKKTQRLWNTIQDYKIDFKIRGGTRLPQKLMSYGVFHLYGGSAHVLRRVTIFLPFQYLQNSHWFQRGQDVVPRL